MSLLPILDQPSAPPMPRGAPVLGGQFAGEHLVGLTSAPVPLAERCALPMSAEEMRERGWDAVDVVFVSGDAYIDHPSFAAAILGRVLEAAGFRVGIVAQPDWHSCHDWRRFGRPRVCFAISAGNMDSMINHYTANRKVRNDDAYSPGGRIGRRPDRATLAYCQRAREAYKGVPVIAGGVEASLRRLAHYDYWSEKVRRSILLDSKADLVVYGMGENPIVELVQRLAAGQSVRDLRDMRGVAYALGARESAELAATLTRRVSEGEAGSTVELANVGWDQAAPVAAGPPTREVTAERGATSEREECLSPSPPRGEGRGEWQEAQRTSNIEHPTSNTERGSALADGPPRGNASAFDVGCSMLDVRCSAAPGGPALAARACPTLLLPSYEAIVADKLAFADATRLFHNETNPYNARRLVQFHGREAVVVNPPQLPISQGAMDRIYALPYTRRPHPSYREPIPAFEMIKDSLTLMRGCFGGCTFCSITAHQGRTIQSRSQESVLAEIHDMTADPAFKGVISDIGGPTANMYEMICTRPEVEAVCRRQSCVHPKICKLLGTDHGPLIELMRKARTTPGIRKVLVASGIRMDLARRSPEYMSELVRHHVGGHLKVAPEHVDPEVLMRMRKPANDDFEEFTAEFQRQSRRAGKKQYIVPYFIASHPGSDLSAMIELALFLKRNGYRPDQVQDFIPAPMDVATCMYYTGLDPFTGRQVYVAQHLRDRKLQRALMQFFKPENYFEVREALRQAGRTDLIGNDCDSLIPDRPPKEAIARRRKEAKEKFRGEYVHTIAVGDAQDDRGERRKSKAKRSRHETARGYRPERKQVRKGK